MPRAGQTKIKETVKQDKPKEVVKEIVKVAAPEQVVISKEDLELLTALKEVRAREKKVEAIKAMKKLKAEELKEKQEREREKIRVRDGRIVKGKFEYNELAGGSFSFSYFKHPKDGSKKYTLIDGHTYDLPLSVAEHINNNCRYPVHEHTTDKEGNPVQTIGRWVQRASFKQEGFIDYSDTDSLGAVGPSNLITVRQG